MKARVSLFLAYYGRGYCIAAAWREADRQKAFQRRRRKKHAHG